jgi:RNA polymerase sigma-70 factor (ECF subfamily)
MKRTAQPDAILVKNYQNGDDSAFEQLLLRYKSKVYSTIYLIVKDRDEAEDLMQETFIKVIDTIKGGRYNEEGKFAPWLMRIAHNMAIDHFRRNKRYPTIVMDDESAFLETRLVSYQNGENEKIKAELQQQIRALIKQLPDTQRQVLVMRHFAGLSFQEIADLTGVSINTALGRMRYALINIRKKLTQTDPAYVRELYP